MCSAFTPDFRYNNSLIKFIGKCTVRIQCVRINFACTKTPCNLSKRLKEATINVLNACPFVKCAMFHSKRNQFRFSWSFVKGFIFLKKHYSLMGICIVPTLSQQTNSVCAFQPAKHSWFYDCKMCKACCSHVLNKPFKDQKPTIKLFSVDSTNCFARKTSGDYEKGLLFPFLKEFLRHSQSSTPELVPKRRKIFHSWHNRVDSQLVPAVNQKFISILIIYTFSLQ